MKVVRLSALRTGRFYPPENIPGTYFYQRLSRPQGHSAAERIMSMKNSNDTIGNRPLLGPNILLSTLFSKTLSLCSSLSVRDQVSYPYKTTGKIITLISGFRRDVDVICGLLGYYTASCGNCLPHDAV
jgi:hypothetical protein